MAFSDLKSNVANTMGRSDLPDNIYKLATERLKRELRVLDMETTATLSADSEYVALPADFVQMVSAYVDDDTRSPLRAYSTNTLNLRRGDTGEPWGYSITSDGMKLLPTPDGTYSIFIRYLASITDLVDDADTNVLLTNHEGLYQYAACLEAAIFARDEGAIAIYREAYGQALEETQKANNRKRHPSPLQVRSNIDHGRARA